MRPPCSCSSTSSQPPTAVSRYSDPWNITTNSMDQDLEHWTWVVYDVLLNDTRTYNVQIKSAITPPPPQIGEWVVLLSWALISPPCVCVFDKPLIVHMREIKIVQNKLYIDYFFYVDSINKNVMLIWRFFGLSSNEFSLIFGTLKKFYEISKETKFWKTFSFKLIIIQD
jgi:hypothetical protein